MKPIVDLRNAAHAANLFQMLKAHLKDRLVDDGSAPRRGQQQDVYKRQAQGYAPLEIRNSIVPLVNFGSSLSMPLLLAGPVRLQLRGI